MTRLFVLAAIVAGYKYMLHIDLKQGWRLPPWLCWHWE